MKIENTFAKARNANYIEPLTRPITICPVPKDVASACIANGMSEQLVLGQMTMWIDQVTLDNLDASIDQRPFARVGTVCNVLDVVGPYGIYGEDASGRRVASGGIYRVNGGALVTFGYM